MANTFAEASYSVQSYDAHRPRYPKELYETILNYHEGGNELAIDLGCGTGIATTDLIRYGDFESVVGVDPSEPMIHYANLSRQAQGLEFRVGRAEDLSWTGAGSVDMLMAGTAAHWFSPSWWTEAARVLKPGGTVAVFIYGGMWPDPRHPKAQELRETMFSFVNELGHSSAGNVICHNMYDQLPLPNGADEFIGFERIDWNRDGKGDRLLMGEMMRLGEWRERARTFGPAHRWRLENPEKCGSSEDPIERTAEKIKSIGSIDESTEFICGHSLSLILLRRGYKV